MLALSRRPGASMTQYLFKNFQMLDPEHDELRGGYELLVEGEQHQGSLRTADQGAGCGRHRLRRAHADAGPDRQPRACGAVGGLASPAREHPPHLDDGARGCPHARHARPRLHQRARHRRRRLGPQGGDRQVAAAGAAAVHRRQGAGAHGRAQRRPPPHRPRHALPLLRRAALRHGAGRRGGRGAQGRARGDAPGRRPGEDHDVGRRRLALRPARQPAVLARGGGRRRRGGARLRPLRLRPRLHRWRPSRARPTPACAPSSTAT